jgi:hypothetical protein
MCGAAAVVLISASGASAASAATIYKDYADNGRLDGRYSGADLRAALKSGVIQGYGGPIGEQMTAKIKDRLARHLVTHVVTHVGTLGKAKFAQPLTAGARRGKEGGTLPFTGRDLTLIAAAALALFLFGAGLRRLGRETTDVRTPRVTTADR